MEYEAVIGLEVHAQLNTRSKIFCGCSTCFGSLPNENTCPVCLGLPGALPVLNEKVVELALKAALAVHCAVPPVSVFARKNYFYPDLPKGYQISQYDKPLAVDGHITLQPGGRKIRIKRIHMEEDAGKLMHEGIESDNDSSFIDLNRAGVPLIEIVTEPDLRNPEEAYLYLKELKSILRFCEVSEANMEEGNLRCDANVSLRLSGAAELGTRVEIKNLNSFKNVQRALEYEMERQKKLLTAGAIVNQETRLFDADKSVTEPMRSKEEEHDYRYFPDPDLLPLAVSAELIESVERSLPELPEAKRIRFQQEHHLSEADVSVLTEDRALADYFEEAVKAGGEPKLACNWIQRDLLEKLKEGKLSIQQSPVRPAQIAELVQLIRKQAISSTQGKEVFLDVWTSGKDPSDVVREKGLLQISDEDAVARYVNEVADQNPDIIARYRNGETRLQGVLVGLVMKASGGKANPALVNRLLKERLL